MFKATYIDFSNHGVEAGRAGWYITDPGGALLGNGRRYDTQAQCLEALASIR